jgi:hypothetical protein
LGGCSAARPPPTPVWVSWALEGITDQCLASSRSGFGCPRSPCEQATGVGGAGVGADEAPPRRRRAGARCGGHPEHPLASCRGQSATREVAPIQALRWQSGLAHGESLQLGQPGKASQGRRNPSAAAPRRSDRLVAA